jgi:hypothetical protein
VSEATRIDFAELDRLLRESAADAVLDDDEKLELRQLGASLARDRVRYLRNRAFDLVRERWADPAFAPMDLLRWLEQVVRTLDAVADPPVMEANAWFSPGEDCLRESLFGISAYTALRHSGPPGFERRAAPDWWSGQAAHGRWRAAATQPVRAEPVGARRGVLVRSSIDIDSLSPPCAACPQAQRGACGDAKQALSCANCASARSAASTSASTPSPTTASPRR